MTNAIRCWRFAVLARTAFPVLGQNTEQDKTCRSATNNLVAWCFVPFDAQTRGPASVLGC